MQKYVANFLKDPSFSFVATIYKESVYDNSIMLVPSRSLLGAEEPRRQSVEFADRLLAALKSFNTNVYWWYDLSSDTCVPSLVFKRELFKREYRFGAGLFNEA